MKRNYFLKKMSLLLLGGILSAGAVAQSRTVFSPVGGNLNSASQNLFPGSLESRPVMADFINNGHMDLFYGGQDAGGSSGWYSGKTDNRWGDQGDGTYVNPILNADFSDPDVIRVGNKYYMICSEFHFMGMPVMESDDMVNWKIIGQIYDSFPFDKYDKMEAYGEGAWAPSLRYHDGKFWMFVCSPNEGLFMSNAENPAGPWSPLHHVKNVSGWEDPCPLWDDNGQAYLGRSHLGGGTIIVHKMSWDGKELLDDGVPIHYGPTAEGTKMFKKDGLYYLNIPEGGVGTGWETILKSDNIYGPYEKRIVLEQGPTHVNGPHQGALVDTPEGEWWFYHFQSSPNNSPRGRVVHLQPVTWVDGWPQVGENVDDNGLGQPVKQWVKPNVGATYAISAPQGSDDFTSEKLHPRWQFNHNPVHENWSLTQRLGYLSIKALKADKLRDSRNMFTQKVMGYMGEASLELDCSDMVEGQRAGLLCIGGKYNAIGVSYSNGTKKIYVEQSGTVRNYMNITSDVIYFKVTLDDNERAYRFYYSYDDKEYTAIGSSFEQTESDWKGGRVGLFSYNTISPEGIAYFNWFRYEFDGPGLQAAN